MICKSVQPRFNTVVWTKKIQFIKYLSMCKDGMSLKRVKTRYHRSQPYFAMLTESLIEKVTCWYQGPPHCAKMHKCKFSYLGSCIWTPKGAGGTVGMLVQIEVTFDYIAQSPPAFEETHHSNTYFACHGTGTNDTSWFIRIKQPFFGFIFPLKKKATADR